MKYNVLDLFCGCGGFSLGFIDAGYNILLATDYDKEALQSYSTNHKNIEVLYADINEIKFKSDIKPLINKKTIDVIIGGPPCKGMTLSEDGTLYTTENTLFLQYIRLVREIKPKAFVIENIPDIAYAENGSIKRAIIKEFNLLGYSVNHYVLCCSDYGVPQVKERSIFIGIKGDGIKIAIPSHTEKKVSCEDALSDLPTLIKSKENNEYLHEPKNEYQKMMRKKSNILTNHFLSSKKIDEYEDTKKIKSGEPAPNIDTRPKHRNQKHYKYDRLLSVRECARLQSFPDNYVFYGSENQQFMQVGNAIPPLLARNVANLLKKYLDTKS